MSCRHFLPLLLSNMLLANASSMSVMTMRDLASQMSEIFKSRVCVVVWCVMCVSYPKGQEQMLYCLGAYTDNTKETNMPTSFRANLQ